MKQLKNIASCKLKSLDGKIKQSTLNGRYFYCKKVSKGHIIIDENLDRQLISLEALRTCFVEINE